MQDLLPILKRTVPPSPPTPLPPLLHTYAEQKAPPTLSRTQPLTLPCAVELGAHEFYGMLYFPPPEQTRDPFALLPLPAASRGRARKGSDGGAPLGGAAGCSSAGWLQHLLFVRCPPGWLGLLLALSRFWLAWQAAPPHTSGQPHPTPPHPSSHNNPTRSNPHLALPPLQRSGGTPTCRARPRPPSTSSPR